MTTARDQATLGRAIQDRFPRYYRYFSTTAFHFRGRAIRGHNHLLGSVDGVDGIKTGYTRASGFNLVTSMHRGNRPLVGVVLGGRSGGSRDAIMRNLLAENIGEGGTTRTVAAITERTPADAIVEVADAGSGRGADSVCRSQRRSPRRRGRHAGAAPGQAFADGGSRRRAAGAAAWALSCQAGPNRRR